MIKRIFLLGSFCLLGYTVRVHAQADTVNTDTVFVDFDVNRPVEFNKGRHKYLYLRNMIPDDIPAKELSIQVISSNSTELNVKKITIQGLDVIIPIYLFEEKYYSLHVKKGRETRVTKRILVR